MESDTPRTDAEDWQNLDGGRDVDAEFCRKLERELADMRRQRDEARRVYRALLDGIKDAASPREKEGGGA